MRAPAPGVDAKDADDGPVRVRTPADRRRVHGFAGLSIGRLGGRAYTAISETFLTLLVAGRTGSAFAVTFATSAHRLVEWAMFPVVGAVSDNRRGALGRRVPFVAGSLLAMAAFTWTFTLVPGYWPLVAVMVAARLAATTFAFASFVVVPEVFGRSRWVRATAAVAVAGAVIAVSIRVVVIGTWDDDDPSTWNATFRLAAVYMVLAGLAVLALVREVPQPAAEDGASPVPAEADADADADAATADDAAPARTWRDRLRAFVSSPEARVPGAGLLVATFAGGAMGRLYPLFLREELDVSTAALAALPAVTAPLFLLVVVPAGILLAGRVNRRTNAVVGGVAMLVLPLSGLVVQDLAQATFFALLGGVFFVSSAVALIPATLGALPAEGSLGERIGTVAGPIGVATVAGTYAAGLVAEVAGLRAMWLVPAACGVLLIAIYRRLPDDGAPGGLARVLLPLVALRRGPRVDRRLFGGTVDAADADGSVVIDHARALAERMMATTGAGPSPAARVALAALAGEADRLAPDALLLEDGTPTAAGAPAVAARLAALPRLGWAEVDRADHPPAHAESNEVAVLAARPGHGLGHVRVGADLGADGRHVVALWVDTIAVPEPPAGAIEWPRAPIPVALGTDRRAMRRRSRHAWLVLGRHLGPLGLRRLARRPIDPRDRGERLTAAFARLGGTYVKFGQLLAAAPDLAGPELATPLRRLLDAGPPLRPAEVEHAMAADLGRPVGELFASVEPTPLGAGSLAVVHGAVTTDGRRVAVKVLRPGIEALVAADLDVLAELVPLLAPVAPVAPAGAATPGAATPVDGLLDGLRLLRRQLAEELDLRNELLTMRYARSVLPVESVPDVVVPEPDPGRSGRRVLTMARVDGVPLDDAAGIAALGHDPAPLLDQALRAWFTNALRYRTFHGDVHAGNLLICTDGRLAVLDWGITGRLRPAAHAALVAIVAASLGDDEALGSAARLLAGTLAGTDEPPLELVDVIASQLRASFAAGPDRVTMGAFLRRARDDARRATPAPAGAPTAAAPTAAGVTRDPGVDHGLYLLAKQMLYFERYADGRGDRPLLDDDAFFHALLAGEPLPPWPPAR